MNFYLTGFVKKQVYKQQVQQRFFERYNCICTEFCYDHTNMNVAELLNEHTSEGMVNEIHDMDDHRVKIWKMAEMVNISYGHVLKFFLNIFIWAS